MQVLVFWEEFQDGLIGAVNIFLVSRKSYPSEGSLTFTEQWSDVCGDETRELEGV
jgi:hypothetical protein